MATAKQIAWRKKFAEMARSGKFKKSRGKKATTRRNPAPAVTPAAAPTKRVKRRTAPRTTNPAPKKRRQTPRGGCNPVYKVRVQSGGRWYVVGRETSLATAEAVAQLLHRLGLKAPIQVWR